MMLKGTALRRMVMSLLETGWHPMTVFTTSLWTRNPTPCLWLSSFQLEKTLCPFSVVVSPKFFNLISQSPRMFHLNLSISCVSSAWSFPATPGVLVFHVPMVMLSLPRIFNDAPVAFLTPLCWYTEEGVPCWPGRRPIQYGMVASFHYIVSHGQGANWRSPSLSRSNTWPLSSSWIPSAHLALVFELWRYPPSDVLTPAISPKTGRLVESGSVLFLPAQVQTTCPMSGRCMKKRKQEN